MKLPIVLVALIATAPAAHAKSLKDDAFFQAARKATFYCELASSDLAFAKQYNAVPPAEDRQKVVDCLTDARQNLLSALKAIPTDTGSNALREAAKRVYSTWDPYSSFLVRGVGSREVERSAPAQEYRQALVSYQTEVELAD